MIEPISSENKQFISENSRLFTVKNFAKKNQDKGIWPDSEASIWALRANAPENGFGEVFIKVGRRVLVDDEKFWNAIIKLQEVKNGSRK